MRMPVLDPLVPALLPLAVETTNLPNRTVTLDRSNDFTKKEATWEHEDLAQVRIKVLRGHTDSVNTSRFCDNDKKIVTSSKDRTVRLWNAANGQPLHVYDGHSAIVTAASANPDSTRIVSSGWDKKIHVWDLERGEIIWSGDHGGIVTCCDYSHDGQYIVTGSDLDFAVRIWDAKDGTLIHDIKDLHDSTVTSCAFNPRDDRIITTSMDRTTKFWDLNSAKNTITLEGHANVVSDCSCSPDERNLATCSWDKSFLIWDISTGMYRSQGPTTFAKAHEGSVSAVKFSSDGSMVVTGGYDTCVCVWDIQNSIQKLKLQGHGDWVEDVSFSKDQRWLLSCSKDKTVRLWNIEETDKIPVVLENKKSIGLQIMKCANCSKPFSMAQIEGAQDVTTCVFCRLQAPASQLQLE